METVTSWLSVFLYPKKVDSNDDNGNNKVVGNVVRVGGLSSSYIKPKPEAAPEFQMSVHYPRYSKTDYEKMEEWRLDLLLNQYGLTAFTKADNSLHQKRAYAIGTFLWPDQY